MRWTKMLGLALLSSALCAIGSGGGWAEEGDGTPVFVLISGTTADEGEDFVFDPDGGIEGEGAYSPVIVARIGGLMPGDSLEGTVFLAPESLATLNIGDLTLEDLDGNQITILGSVFISGNETQEGPHMFTPEEPDADAPIPPEIQEAFFNASNLGALEAIIPEPGETNPTTHQIAEVVAAHIPSNLDPNFDGDFSDAQEPTAAQIADVASHLFSTTQHLALQEDAAGGDDRVADNGDMFPHTPLGPLFTYELAFSEDGDVEVSDVCKIVVWEIKESSVNIKKKGTMTSVFLTTGVFDATDIDEDAIEIGGVAASKVSAKDVDGDGDTDLQVQWDVPDLVDAGILTSSSTELTATADTTDGQCVTGTSPVNVVSK